MKSKTKIEKQLSRKSNIELIETIIQAKKKHSWIKIADLLSRPRRSRIEVNLDYLDNNFKDDDLIVVAGKVLSQGKLNKKLKIAALNFSESAREKILNSKGEVLSILDEIKKNPDAKGIKILEK